MVSEAKPAEQPLANGLIDPLMQGLGGSRSVCFPSFSCRQEGVLFGSFFGSMVGNRSENGLERCHDARCR